MIKFEQMGLPQALLDSLQKMNFNTPTKIQAQAIPPALQGRDILGFSQTGTGKTAAFGIPLISKVLTGHGSLALVITPTRELATQIMRQLILMLGEKTKINTALLIGGESMPKQTAQLKNRPRIIVGTPGRINDHLQSGNLMLNNTGFLVLDEMDRMLDMGFTVQISKIMKYIIGKPQTLLFSATSPKDTKKIEKRFLVNPVCINIDKSTAQAINIVQESIQVKDENKYSILQSQLREREGAIIVFVKTKYGADKMAFKLSKSGHKADAIHGNLSQNQRNRVINDFRNKKYRILIATDIAARGLDIPHIKHVINYDLPQCAEDFIHRIGRTARAGAHGFALNFIGKSDNKKWSAINQLINA